MRCTATLFAVSVAMFSASALAGTTYGGHPSKEDIDNAYGPVPDSYKPKFDPYAPDQCLYGGDGWLKVAKSNGCPIKVQPTPPPKNNDHPHHDDTTTTSCSTSGGGLLSLISIDLLNCSSLCILSVHCPRIEKTCTVKSEDGTLLDVKALDCSTINILSN